MKRLIALLMMTLLIVTFLGADLFARQTPWNRNGDRNVIGDDHPWGGEADDGDDPNSQNSIGDTGDIGTGSLTLDWIVSRLVFRYFEFNYTTFDRGHYRLLDTNYGQDNQTNTETPEANTERN